MRRESLQVSYCWPRSDGGTGRAAQAVTVSSVVGAGAGQSEEAGRGGAGRQHVPEIAAGGATLRGMEVAELSAGGCQCSRAGDQSGYLTGQGPGCCWG